MFRCLLAFHHQRRVPAATFAEITWDIPRGRPLHTASFALPPGRKPLPRSTTLSIRQSFPERPFPFTAVDASPLRSTFGASPLSSSGSSTCADFWRLASLRLTVASLSLPFGPSLVAALPASSRRVAIP